MSDKHSWPAALAHVLHRHLFLLLVLAYVVAAFLPGPGLWLRSVHIGGVGILGQHLDMSLPALLLAVLLFNAGLGVAPAQMRGLARRPGVLLAGLLANLAVPLVFVLGVSWLLVAIWHNPTEAQCVLVGLALVAAMPVAGSSTAWSQNADGNVALSLGLVLGSTLLSPLTTPAVFLSAGTLGSGEYAERLGDLAGQGTGMFLALCVLMPSVLGIACRLLLGEPRTRALLPGAKLINALALLVLCYANAAVSLPEAVANPDPDFVIVMLTVVVGLCVAAFGSGWLLAWLLKVDAGERAALMFGLGMNNNGTGLVLASLALAAYPRVMQPILLYNLVQHLIAAAVAPALSPRRPEEPAPEAAEPAPVLRRAG
jgi:BASS family bile acid:Na+ symporter